MLSVSFKLMVLLHAFISASQGLTDLLGQHFPGFPLDLHIHLNSLVL